MATSFDPTVFRAEFPLADTWTYLNHAGTGPVPRSHVTAAGAFLAAMNEGKPPTLLSDSASVADAIRARAARLLSSAPADIAVLSSTTEALGVVPLGLAWAEGDEVITYARDYPSVVYALQRLQRLHGVRIRWIADRDGRFDLADVAALIGPRTRLISLSLVSFANGFRAPIEAIAELCRPRGIWLSVDAIQGMGAITLDAPALGADVLAAHGYKHLLSGYGVALAYCSPRVRVELAVGLPGWNGTETFIDPTAMLDHTNMRFSPDARRFEPAVPNFAGMHGTIASLDLLLRAGPEAIERHVRGLLDEAARELMARGYPVASPTAPSERSSVLSFRTPAGLDVAALARRLTEAKVTCSLREGMIRISPHLYNTQADIARLLEHLPPGRPA
jgi:cysteine desulfurase / selenocysteine lyase